jgi:hypothetical protein
MTYILVLVLSGNMITTPNTYTTQAECQVAGMMYKASNPDADFQCIGRY